MKTLATILLLAIPTTDNDLYLMVLVGGMFIVIVLGLCAIIVVLNRIIDILK